MNIVKGEMNFTCNKCNTEHIISAYQTEFINNYYTERKKSPQFGFTWKYNLKCKCGNDIEIEYEITEYPEGIFHSDHVYVKNGKLTSKFDHNL